MIATPARGRHQVLAQMPPKGLQDRMRLALSLHGLGQMAVEAPDSHRHRPDAPLRSAPRSPFTSVSPG